MDPEYRLTISSYLLFAVVEKYFTEYSLFKLYILSIFFNVFFLQWDEFLARKPQAGKNHPDDEILLSITTRTIGDYHLKESPDYKPNPDEKDSTLKKYHELLKARLKVSNINNIIILGN